MERRNFIRLVAAGGVGAFGLPAAVNARSAMITGPATAITLPNTGIEGRVVIVGGGMAGTTAAKYLRFWGGPNVSVTLIEKESAYTSNIMSNMVITQERSLDSLVYGYSALATNYGVNVVNAEVTDIDTTNKVVTAGAQTYPYDRLVMAAGLAFDGSSFGADFNMNYTPHAWQAGTQTTQLRDNLAAMADGGTVVVTIPLAPYRCPPGPYERACVIADVLKRTNRPNAQVVVLDSNPMTIANTPKSAIQAEPDRFWEAFTNVGSGYTVDYRPGATITSITSNPDGSGTVYYTDVNGAQSITAQVLNPIPPQTGPQLLKDMGLCDVSGFAPVDVRSFESTLVANVHVIGDSCKTAKPASGVLPAVKNVPKAGHIANQEAKTCADGILRLIANPAQSLNTDIVINSACYTPITSTKATWLSAVYNYDAAYGTFVPVAGQPKYALSATVENFEDMNTWFRTLMQDTFA